jgi:ATP dependent DNA ligase domain
VTPSQRLQSAYTDASGSQGLFGGPTHWGMKITRLPAGFVIPAQPIRASKPPSGPDWVHEIKHDGYRLIVRRDGPIVRLYTRNAYDWTVRLPAIAGAAVRIKAKSFTIDGEAVILGPDGLSRFDELPADWPATLNLKTVGRMVNPHCSIVDDDKAQCSRSGSGTKLSCSD